jgi:hypothetical protein
MQRFDLKSKVALVTSGNGGIGSGSRVACSSVEPQS